ncbi:MAG: 3-deoxy-D-manno-octulosonic acid transferase, partial [Candidatus Muiribacteriaceae bacterium]
MIYLRFFDKNRYRHLHRRYSYDRTTSLAPGRKKILVHAVSVGEVVASRPLIEKLLRERKDEYAIVVSTVTETGAQMARKLFGDKVHHVFFPLDFPSVCKDFLDIVDPSLVLIAETEIWPAFLRQLFLRCIPVIIYNGRISPGSFRNYYYFRRFFKEYINIPDIIAVQSEQDKEKLVEIGASEKRISVMGNLKFESLVEKVDTGSFNTFAHSMAIPAHRKVIIAGSTHDEENSIMLHSYMIMKESIRDLTLIIAPRHLKYVPVIEKEAEEKGLDVIRRTEIDPDLPNEAQVVILDTIGELQFAYGISDMAFVGGSLVPTGGHNILEALKFGIPVFFGPHMFNFDYISSEALERGCGFEIHDSDELASGMLGLFKSEEKYIAIDDKAINM